jgi:uncharacterized protein (DUF488 family)
MTESSVRVYSIGHSNHSLATFTRLLRQHAVTAVIDVRSSPWSRYASQFNSEGLATALPAEKISYTFLGGELGGRPDGDEFYDGEGHVLYGRLADTDAFKRGLAQVEREAREGRTALMCAEEDPTDCHRRLLVGRVLIERGADVVHIRGDGRLQSDAELEGTSGQQSLFPGEEEPWRSTRSVSRRQRRATSSAG